jgi:hypothetical protein
MVCYNVIHTLFRYSSSCEQKEGGGAYCKVWLHVIYFSSNNCFLNWKLFYSASWRQLCFFHQAHVNAVVDRTLAHGVLVFNLQPLFKVARNLNQQVNAWSLRAALNVWCNFYSISSWIGSTLKLTADCDGSSCRLFCQAVSASVLWTQ